MTRTPTSLLERRRQPFEPEAWARFVALDSPSIYSWGRRAGPPEQDAADLVQDVFVVLLRVPPTFTYDRRQRLERRLTPGQEGQLEAGRPAMTWMRAGTRSTRNTRSAGPCG